MGASDTITIDLTNFRDRMGGRVPEGRYLVRVDHAEKDRSNQGNTMVNVFLVVADGEYEGSTILDRLVDTEKSQFRFVNFLQAIGLRTPREVLNFKLRSWVGKYLVVDVEDDEYRGRIKSRVLGYMRAEGVAAKAERDVEDIWPQADFEGEGEGDPLDEFGPPITDDSAEDVIEYEEESDERQEEEPAEDPWAGDRERERQRVGNREEAGDAEIRMDGLRPDPVPTTLGSSAKSATEQADAEAVQRYGKSFDQLADEADAEKMASRARHPSQRPKPQDDGDIDLESLEL